MKSGINLFLLFRVEKEALIPIFTLGPYHDAINDWEVDVWEGRAFLIPLVHALYHAPYVPAYWASEDVIY